jgi:hypothetical protein
LFFVSTVIYDALAGLPSLGHYIARHTLTGSFPGAAFFGFKSFDISIREKVNNFHFGVSHVRPEIIKHEHHCSNPHKGW